MGIKIWKITKYVLNGLNKIIGWFMVSDATLPCETHLNIFFCHYMCFSKERYFFLHSGSIQISRLKVDKNQPWKWLFVCCLTPHSAIFQVHGASLQVMKSVPHTPVVNIRSIGVDSMTWDCVNQLSEPDYNWCVLIMPIFFSIYRPWPYSWSISFNNTQTDKQCSISIDAGVINDTPTVDMSSPV